MERQFDLSDQEMQLQEFLGAARSNGIGSFYEDEWWTALSRMRWKEGDSVRVRIDMRIANLECISKLSQLLKGSQGCCCA